MSALTLTVPMPPRLTNGSAMTGHWRGRHARKLAYKRELDERQQAGLLPPPPARPLTHAILASVMVLGAAMDDDNALARHKVVLDWLVSRGYLAGDSRKHVRWAGLPEQRVTRKAAPSITLTLTSIEAP